MAHPAFVAAMGLELKQNRDDLIFEKEYNLNTKPLEIDLLVIKKAALVQVSSEIGRLFKGHNILEYKSPEDHLDILLDTVLLADNDVEGTLVYLGSGNTEKYTKWFQQEKAVTPVFFDSAESEDGVVYDELTDVRRK